jgi:hypothetical protein
MYESEDCSAKKASIMSSKGNAVNSRRFSKEPAGNVSEEAAEMSVVTSPGSRVVGRETNGQSWRLNRQVNLSVLIQLVFLASLIVGSWVNLQRQLDLLQRDVAVLLQCQKDFEQKLESLSAKSISYEYRLRGVEKHILKANGSEKCLLP